MYTGKTRYVSEHSSFREHHVESKSTMSTTNRPEGKRGVAINSILQLFHWNDLITLTLILLVSTMVYHETALLENETPYPTTIFYVLTNVVQVIAPILALGLGALLYIRRRLERKIDPVMLKGMILLTAGLLIALLLLPAVDLLYTRPGVWQGVIVGTILFSVWGLAATIFGFARDILSVE